MENENVIVAVELGSSKIQAAAALKKDDGSMEMLAVASVPTDACVRHGAVHNLDRTADAVVNAVEKLNRKLNAEVKKLYVGYGGKSLRSVPVVVSRDLEEDEVITNELIEDMIVECDNMNDGDLVQIIVASQELKVDHKGTAETDPIGVACSHVDGYFQRLMMKPQVIRLFQECYTRTGYEIADSNVQPKALASLVLTADEKQRGCALVDYGADTVTLSVFKGGLLRYLRVIPLGSSLITKDIMNVFQLNPASAEQLKKEYGMCNLPTAVAPETMIPIEGKDIPLKQLGEVIEARSEEILTNLKRFIDASGYADSLFSGLVLTGGGCRLKNLARQIEVLMPEMLRSPRMAVSVPDRFTWGDDVKDPADGTMLGICAMLAEGTESCCDDYVPEELDPVVTAEEEANMVMGSLFNDAGESAQEERDQKKKEKREAEKRAKAEQKAKEKAERDAQPKKPSLFELMKGKMGKFFDDVQ